MSDEFPDILPDDEFERRLQERRKAERALSTGQAGWDRSGRVPHPYPPATDSPSQRLNNISLKSQKSLFWFGHRKPAPHT